MSSKRRVKAAARVARAASRETKAKGNARSSRPHGLPGRRQEPAATAPPLPSDAQPAYAELLHFFSESADLLCIAGFDGRFKRLNPAWQPTLGWSPAELQAGSFLDFVHPGDRPATLAEMDKLTADATTISFENRYRCKDGSWKWLQWTASPLPGRQEIYGIARDVTVQRGLEREILQTLESERERAGRELHDSLGPHLAAMGYAAAFLANALRQRAQPEAAKAEQLRQMTGEAVSLARNFAHAILPPQLNGGGLSNALEELAHTTSSLTGLAVSFCETGSNQVVDRETVLHLYRIAQEALHNAARHGGARKVTILLHRGEDTLRLAVADDGSGLAPSPTHTRGMGLDSMRCRARVLGGELKIDSHPDEGTVVFCEIPQRPAWRATPAS